MTEQQRQPTEEEIRAYEAELKRVRIEDVVIQTVVSLVNLGGRKAGLGGAEDEKDLDQVRLAVEATRALLPLVEAELGPDAAQVRNALSQLQMAYAKEAPGAVPQAPAAPPAPAAPAAGAPAAGPDAGDSAVQTGRLWIPGQ